MILDDFILESRANKEFKYSGLDQFDKCLDKNYFKNYPYNVNYNFNSRGFRDNEWPDTLEELKNSIWCVGDSFTVGLGSPLEHTWPFLLENITKKRCINVSMDGASNDWISRKAVRILQTVKPKNLVIHWSFLHRIEDSNHLLSDEDRRLWTDKDYNITSQLTNFKKNLLLVEYNRDSTCVVHSLIPDSYVFDVNDHWNKLRGKSWPDMPSSVEEFNVLDNSIKEELKKFNIFDMFYLYVEVFDILKNIKFIPQFEQLDFARDCFHYDKITATKFVNAVVPLIVTA